MELYCHCVLGKRGKTSLKIEIKPHTSLMRVGKKVSVSKLWRKVTFSVHDRLRGNRNYLWDCSREMTLGTWLRTIDPYSRTVPLCFNTGTHMSRFFNREPSLLERSLPWRRSAIFIFTILCVILKKHLSYLVQPQVPLTQTNNHASFS